MKPAVSEPRCTWAAGATLGEGCCWSSREQALWWLDILEHKLYRWTPSGATKTEWTLPDTVSALAEREHAPGLIVTLRRGFAFFDPAGGALQRLVEPEPERAGNRFNDGKCDAAGRFWGGTMDFDCVAPTGALYRLDGDGRCERMFDAGWTVTNGPTWSADGRTMFCNDTIGRTVFRFDFGAERGTLGDPQPFIRFADDDGFPDGMTTDADGRLWIAHWGAGCVSCHDGDSGAELARIALPTGHVTNVAFGGPDLSTLYITTARTGLSAEQLAAQPLAGALFEADTNARGLPAHRFSG